MLNKERLPCQREGAKALPAARPRLKYAAARGWWPGCTLADNRAASPPPESRQQSAGAHSYRARARAVWVAETRSRSAARGLDSWAESRAARQPREGPALVPSAWPARPTRLPPDGHRATGRRPPWLVATCQHQLRR